ncbi:hypothetical protein MIMGU_mgv1a025044mg [Erythranthe guttata]|uniref:NB-ARC domain-containing protein n=1 Tax=Erythranthe guttata TaxID=4155 RepID=A0A022Q8J4_ERYGU|nr:hypothetical protein MIMGU_mgv1a025044mg [Erythranthe guttata]
MAAYAALVSLMNTMDHIKNHPRHSISLDEIQTESLRDKAGFLLDFIENDTHGVITKQAQVLVSQIAAAAYSAEDVIESHVVDQIHDGCVSLLDLSTVIEDIDSIKKMVMEFKDDRIMQPTAYSMPTTNSSTPLTTTDKNTMVGFDEQLLQLLDVLTGQQSNRQIIPIVGMGGIGKTTLAKNAYEHSLIMQYFDIRAWATVSQMYNVREILLLQLFCSQMSKETVKRFFPNNDNGSRIVVTTRISNVASYFNSLSLEMTFLDKDHSWKLFCENAFGQVLGCPPELENIGKGYHIIRDSHMIKLWVAEGFIKPNKSQSLEEIARGYLNDLIDMNLILKHSLGSNGKIQYCKIHDLLRDLCLKVSQKDKFVCMMNDIPQVWGIPTRSIRMLRVIVVFGKLWTTKKILIQDAFAQVNLRYLDYERFLFGKIPSSITMLWNVQNLYIKGLRGGADAPSEIWEMRQLRHVHIMGLVLPDPSPSDQKDDSVLLNNLQTLKKVNNLRYSVEVCKRVLNVKTLSIQYNKFAKRFKDNCLYNCCRLQKLESLKFQYPREHDALQDLTFLSSLKKLYLRCCTIKWEDLTTIGSLPHLEVLKLRLSPNTAGHVWNPIEGEFLRLKFLFIECIYLVNWNADSSHFPVLEKLVLEEMEKLEEIPLDIGEIPALGAISLKSCSESSAISAVKIAEERENGGNEALQLQVEFFYKAQMESFLEKMERESLTINNLELKLTSNW